ncbi:MAG TPA: ATP-binding protein [Magnetospirillum sp.]|nr:ATP-binding protein [Magnetospirillum sp.]
MEPLSPSGDGGAPPLGLERAVARVGLLVIAVLALFFVAIGVTQLRQANIAADARARLAPTILDRHRMAINLHRMMAAGDLVVAAVSPERRREAMLTARAIGGHPAFLSNEQAHALMAQSSQVVREVAEMLARRDALPDSQIQDRAALTHEALRRWQASRQTLESLADQLVVEAASLTTDRFDALAEGSRLTTWVTLGGLASAGLVVVALVIAARRLVVRPVVAAVRALRRVHLRQPPELVPAPPIAEFAILDRDIQAVRGLVEDLSQAREELERSNQDLEQFAYVASHDLREPLRMVTSFLGLIERRYGTVLNEEGHEFIGYAVEGASRMDRLILDLLTYSRVGRVSSGERVQALSETIAGAVAALGATIAEAGAEVQVAADLPAVRGDHEELTRLFQNLIGNALKYHDPDRPPKVSVTAQRDGAVWRIAVADNGIGIDPQYFDRIFLLFQRLHTRDAYQGTGIGLAICKKIAEHHGGAIRVQSVPGEGSTFTVELPAAD